MEGIYLLFLVPNLLEFCFEIEYGYWCLGGGLNLRTELDSHGAGEGTLYT